MLYFHKGGIVQKMIHNLKYRGNEKIGVVLGEWYANELKNNPIINSVTEIIPVPLHKKRLNERGYNQVDSFCKALSKELNIPFNNNLLKRKKYSKTQTTKNKIERQLYSASVFDVSFSERDENKHFLLIDDVITTGSTLELCAKALLKIPNTKVSIVTIAFTDS
jgi:ComF family protein